MLAQIILSNYLNDDVTMLIDDYLYQLYHRELLNKMTNSLIRESYLRLYNRCLPFEMYEIIGMDECINMFKVFENCNCCEEHNENKPTIITSMLGMFHHTVLQIEKKYVHVHVDIYVE